MPIEEGSAAELLELVIPTAYSYRESHDLSNEGTGSTSSSNWSVSGTILF